MKRPVSILELVKVTHTKKGTTVLNPRARRTVERVEEAITQRSQHILTEGDTPESAQGSVQLTPRDIDEIYLEVILNISLYFLKKHKFNY